jgi:hypothetical protein
MARIPGTTFHDEDPTPPAWFTKANIPAMSRLVDLVSDILEAGDSAAAARDSMSALRRALDDLGIKVKKPKAR